jgi:hypothetical protein
MDVTLQELTASSTEMAEQTSALQAEHTELTRQHNSAQVSASSEDGLGQSFGAVPFMRADPGILEWVLDIAVQ